MHARVVTCEKWVSTFRKARIASSGEWSTHAQRWWGTAKHHDHMQTAKLRILESFVDSISQQERRLRERIAQHQYDIMPQVMRMRGEF